MSARIVLAAFATVVLAAIAGVALWTRTDARRASETSDDVLAAVERARPIEPQDPGTTPIERDVERTSAASAKDVGRPFATPPAADRAAVAGRVVDEGNRGITSAELVLVRADANGATVAKDATSSIPLPIDTYGAFAQSDLDPGRWTIVAKAPGRVDARVELGELRAGEPRTDVLVRLVRPPRVRGVVRWPDGTLAIGAEVLVESVEARTPDAISVERSGLAPDVVRRLRERSATAPKPLLRTRTDAQGSFPVELASGTRFRVTARDVRALGVVLGAERAKEIGLDVAEREIICARTIEGEWPPKDELVLVLEPRACVVGRVTDVHGAPVEGVRVGRERNLQGPRVAETSDDGVFVIDDLDLEPTTIHVRPSHAFGSSSFRTEGVTRIERHDVVVEPLAAVEGVVLGTDGLPLANAIVELRSSENERPTDDTTAFGDGSFVFDADDFDAARMRRSMESDDDGRFRFEDVASGWVLVSARTTGAYSPAPFVRRIAPGERIRDAVVHLALAGSVRGRATRADGSPIVGASVYLRSELRKSGPWAPTGNGGSFTFDCVPPGNWRVLLDANDSGDDSLADLRAEATITVTAGETTNVTLVAR